MPEDYKAVKVFRSIAKLTNVDGVMTLDKIKKLRENYRALPNRKIREEIEKLGVEEHFYNGIAKRISENPPENLRKILHEMYKFEGNKATSAVIFSRANAKDHNGLLVLHEMGVIDKTGQGSTMRRAPDLLVFNNKELIKRLFPKVEEWKEGEEKEGRRDYGELRQQALAILGQESFKELGAADVESINNLRKIDFIVRKFPVKPKSMSSLRKGLLAHAARNEMEREAEEKLGKNLSTLGKKDIRQIESLKEGDFEKFGWSPNGKRPKSLPTFKRELLTRVAVNEKQKEVGKKWRPGAISTEPKGKQASKDLTRKRAKRL